MTTTVTYTEFRKNLRSYIDLYNAGNTVVVTDGRNGNIITKFPFENGDLERRKKAFEKIKNIKPFLTDEGITSMKRFRNDINKRFEAARTR